MISGRQSGGPSSPAAAELGLAPRTIAWMASVAEPSVASALAAVRIARPIRRTCGGTKSSTSVAPTPSGGKRAPAKGVTPIVTPTRIAIRGGLATRSHSSPLRDPRVTTSFGRIEARRPPTVGARGDAPPPQWLPAPLCASERVSNGDGAQARRMCRESKRRARVSAGAPPLSLGREHPARRLQHHSRS